MASRFDVRVDYASDAFQFAGTVERSRAFAEAIETLVIREVAAKVAERYIAEHYAEIASSLDPQAIANLSIAEGAAAIRETLAKKLPDRVDHHYRETIVPVPVRGGMLGKWKL